MAHNARITLAITDLETQDRPNIAAAARKYQVGREMLPKRFQGVTGTIEDASSYVRQ